MSSTDNYNARSKEMSDSKLLGEISKLREELVENFKKNYHWYWRWNNKPQKSVIKNLQNENKRRHNIVNQLQEKIISLESKRNSVEQYGRQNNMEINGNTNSISDDNLESSKAT